MTKMTAYQLRGWQQPAEFVEVPIPEPGPGEVQLKMAGVGLCRSDFIFLDSPAGLLPYDLPFTLGHENTGWVHELGPGASGLRLGDAVAVAGVHSCGRCRFCLRGADNYCVNGWKGRGYGEDGGLAEFLVVPGRELVPLGSLDPRQVAPLTDAGTTSYHAVRKVAPKLDPGSTALVVGIGGLGAYAVQWLRLLTAARIVAIDVSESRLMLARDLGAAETLLSSETTSTDLDRLLGTDRAAGVFDFVGTDETVRLALGAAATLGAVAIVGAGGGTAAVKWLGVPYECDVFIPQGGTIADLHDVVALAETGVVRIDIEQFAFRDAPEAYERFRSGDLRSRAVVLPHG